MSITNNAVTRGGKKTGYASWAVNGQSDDANAGEIVKADPGAGYSLCLEYLEINCIVDGTVTIRADTTTVLGPFSFEATGPVPIVLHFSKNPNDLMEGAIILPENKELQVITGGAYAVQVYVEGHTIEV